MKCVHLPPRVFMPINGNMSRCTPLKSCCHNVQIGSLFEKKKQSTCGKCHLSKSGGQHYGYLCSMFILFLDYYQ